jgi:PAS domain S-box-containing protein
MTVGQRLRELRKAKGISQRELANKVGTNFTYLSKLETGAIPRPGEKIILALAKVLDADPDELFGLTRKIPPDITEQIDTETIKGLRYLQDLHRRVAEPAALEIDFTKGGKAEWKQENFYQALIEKSLDGVIVINDHLAPIYVNPSATHILGYESGEFTAADLFKVHHQEDVSELFRSYTKLTQNISDTERNEVRVKHKDGTWHKIEAIGLNLLHDPLVKGIVISFRDITERGSQNVMQEHSALAMVKKYKLTEKEHKVLMLMAEGLSNPQIAERLVLSTSTVRFHVSNILSKLGVTNRIKAVALATRHHLVI